jgi:hypothetical protein
MCLLDNLANNADCGGLLEAVTNMQGQRNRMHFTWTVRGNNLIRLGIALLVAS